MILIHSLANLMTIGRPIIRITCVTVNVEQKARLRRFIDFA